MPYGSRSEPTRIFPRDAGIPRWGAGRYARPCCIPQPHPSPLRPWVCRSTIARRPAINTGGESRARGAPRVPSVGRPPGLRRMGPHSAALPLTRGRSSALLAMCPPPPGWGRSASPAPEGRRHGVPAMWGYPTREEQRGFRNSGHSGTCGRGHTPNAAGLRRPARAAAQAVPQTASRNDRHARRAIAEREEPGTNHTNQ